jgi:hypothetical protein
MKLQPMRTLCVFGVRTLLNCAGVQSKLNVPNLPRYLLFITCVYPAVGLSRFCICQVPTASHADAAAPRCCSVESPDYLAMASRTILLVTALLALVAAARASRILQTNTITLKEWEQCGGEGGSGRRPLIQLSVVLRFFKRPCLCSCNWKLPQSSRHASR